MTHKLADLFNISEETEDDPAHIEQAKEITTTALNTLDKIDNALPQVRGLDATDGELDELATMAVNSYKDLTDLGMQTESRFSAEIFGVASTLLGHAITAKTAKINKKLKVLDLQLKKAALDQKMSAKDKEIEATPIGEGRLFDRNDLLKSLANKSSAE